MRTLQICLFAEGATDTRFLPRIIYRLCVNIVSSFRRTDVDIDVPNIVVPENKKISLAEQILSVARQAHIYDILVVHLDADHPSREPALRQRLQPGLDLILQEKDTGQVCPHILPIIPIHSIEAWMIADAEALRTTLSTTMSPSDLGTPNNIRQIETISKPKKLFNDIIRKSQSHRTKQRRRDIDLEDIHNMLADEIQLDRLTQLSSFKAFSDDLSKILQDLHLIDLNS